MPSVESSPSIRSCSPSNSRIPRMVARTSSGTASQHGPRPDRAASYALLEEPVTRARYVNAARAELLAKLKVTRVRDLLTCYPHRYLDMSTVVSTAAWAPIRVNSSWYAPSRTRSNTGGSISSTERDAASAMMRSSRPCARRVP